MPVPLSLISVLSSRSNAKIPDPESFETFSGGLPENWTLGTGHSNSRVVADTSWFTDGAQSCEITGEYITSTLYGTYIYRVLDLSLVDTITLDMNIKAASFGGPICGIDVYDNYGNEIDSYSNFEEGIYTVTLDLAGANPGDKDSAEIQLSAGFTQFNGAGKASWDNMQFS